MAFALSSPQEESRIVLNDSPGVPATQPGNLCPPVNWPLWGIVLLGAVLRFYHVAYRSIWYDEGWTIAFSKQLGLSLSYVDKNVTTDAPLLPFLVRLMREFLDRLHLAAPGSYTHDLFLRSIPCVLSILTLILCYQFVIVLFKDKKTALATTALCAISPFQIFYAQELKPYSLLLAVSLITLIFLIRSLENDRPFDWLFLSLFLGIGMYAHVFAVWNIVLVNVYFLATIRRRFRLIPQWIVTQFIAGAIALPIVIFSYQWSQFYEQIQNIWTIRPGYRTPFLTFKTFFAGYGATVWAYWALFLLCMALFIYGLWRLRRNKDRLTLVLIFTILFSVANVIIWRHRHFPFYEYRTFIVASVFVYAVVATALVGLPGRGLRIGAWVLIVALSAVGLRDYYVQNLHAMETHRTGVRYKVQNREAANYIASNLTDRDVVIHTSHFTYFPFLHYLPTARQHHIRITEGELTGFLHSGPNVALWNTYQAAPIPLDEAVQGARRVWYVESWWEPFNVPPDIQKLRTMYRERLKGEFREKQERRFDGIRVTLYEK